MKISDKGLLVGSVDDPKVEYHLTENCWKGIFEKRDPVGCIIHYDAAGNASDTVYWFKKKGANASAHVVIARNGRIIQTVSFYDAAWHAGKSQIIIDGKKYKKLNKWMLGIELSNWGLLRRVEKGNSSARFYCWPPLSLDGKPMYQTEFLGDYEFANGQWWEKFTNEQMESLALICRAMMSRYNWDERRFVGHNEVAPGRKIDPGDAFDWVDFRERLVGNWELKSLDLRMKEIAMKQGDRRDC